MATDEVLMLQFQAGSRESFEDLFSRYRDPVYAFFRRRSGCRESAEDLAQELWVAVMKGALKYEPRAPFRTYVFGIAFKLLAGERRKNAKQNTIRASDAPIASAEATDVERWTREALGKLEATDREIIMLREYEQLSYGEIAHLLRIPMNTVRSRLFRARMALKHLLEPGTESKAVKGRF